MKLKDFMKIVIFGVIGFILMMAGSMASMLTGVLAPYINASFGTFAMAPVFFVMCHKIHKKNTILIYYLLIGLVYTLMGFWAFMPFMVALAIISELIIGKEENYTDNKKLSLNYIITQFIYGLHGFIFLLVLKGDGLIKLFPKMFDADKIKFLSNFYFNAKNVIILMAIQLVISYLATLFGIYIYEKFFDKNKVSKTVLE